MDRGLGQVQVCGQGAWAKYRCVDMGAWPSQVFDLYTRHIRNKYLNLDRVFEQSSREFVPDSPKYQESQGIERPHGTHRGSSLGSSSGIVRPQEAHQEDASSLWRSPIELTPSSTSGERYQVHLQADITIGSLYKKESSGLITHRGSSLRSLLSQRAASRNSSTQLAHRGSSLRSPVRK